MTSFEGHSFTTIEAICKRGGIRPDERKVVSMEVRKCGGAALALAIALACAAPPGAAHADQLVRTYSAGEAVPSELELNGEDYALVSWEPGAGLDTATRSFERTSSKTLPAADYGGEPASHFDGAMAIDEEGFAGAIPLVSARAEVSRSHPERSDYEEAVEFSYITKAELEALPATRRVTVAGRELTLSKLDVKADRVPSDPGIEIYSGAAVYGIHEGFDVPDEYRLTATYAGELSRGPSPATVVATYEGKASEPAETVPDELEQAPQAQDSAGQQRDVSGWMLAIPAAAALAACAALVAVCARFSRAGRRGENGDGSPGAGASAEGSEGGPAAGGVGSQEKEEVEHADCQE